jgi:hypothetical protein
MQSSLVANRPKTYLLLVTLTLAVSFPISAQRQRVAIIQGQLVKSNGRPLPYTEIELVPVTSNNIVNDSRLIGVSGINGKFGFFDVPPGSYTLSINFDDKPTDLSPYATYFYPKTDRREEAQVFQITESTRLRGLIFKMEPALTPKRITGIVTWNDGRPVKEAMIGCRDLKYDRVISFGCARTDVNGAFSIEGFIGRKYQIGAIVFELPLDRNGASGSPGLVVAAGETGVFDLEPSTEPLKIKVFRSKEVQTIVDKYLG